MHGDVTTIEGQTYEPTIELRNEILLNAAGNVSIDGTLTAEDGLATTRNVGITATGGTVSINDLVTGPLLVTITTSQFSQQMRLIWVAESVHSANSSTACNFSRSIRSRIR